MATITITTPGGSPRVYQTDKKADFEEISRKLANRPTDCSVVLFGLKNGGALIIGNDLFRGSIIEISNEPERETVYPEPAETETPANEA